MNDSTNTNSIVTIVYSNIRGVGQMSIFFKHAFYLQNRVFNTFYSENIS